MFVEKTFYINYRYKIKYYYIKMNNLILFLSRKIFSLIPETSCFGLKRCLLRLAGAKIGNKVCICSNVKIIGNGNLTIGDNTWIGHETMIVCSSDITIGANVNIAPRCYIGTGTHEINTDHTIKNVAGLGISYPISIGDGCWICACSTLLPGASVGKQSIVGAGSVLKDSVGNRELWAGVLARYIKKL